MNKTKLKDSAVDFLRKIAAFIYQHKYFLLTVFCLYLFCVKPLSLMATTGGHDVAFHLQRIAAIAEEYEYGNFLPRIYTTVLDGNGYASPLFYGDMFLSIPAYLVAFKGYSVYHAYSVFVALIYVATVLSMYFCTRSITKSSRAAFCGAIMFGISSYLSTDLVTRAALGEAQAFIFIPIAFAGFYHIMYGEIRKWYLLPIGLALMLHCHTLSSMITVFALLLVFLFSTKQIKENPKRLVYLGISVGVFFVLGASFIFPLLEQMSSASFLATDGYASTRWGTLLQRAMPYWSVFYDFNSGIEFFKAFVPNGIGFAGIVFAVIYFINRKKIKDNFIIKLLAISGIFLFLTTDLFPWDFFQELAGVVQFPWRFLIFPTFFGAIAVALYFSKKETKTSEMTISMVLVVSISLFSYISCFMPYFNKFMNYQHEGKTVNYAYTNVVGAAEYLPSSDEFPTIKKYDVNYKRELMKYADTVFSDGQLKTLMERVDGKLIVEFSDAKKDNAYISVPLVMYKGYTATLDDGTELECTYGTYNRIKVFLGDRRSGTITFEYTGTTIQDVSRIVSIIAFVLIGLFIIWERFDYFSKKKKQYETPDITKASNKKKYVSPDFVKTNSKKKYNSPSIK